LFPLTLATSGEHISRNSYVRSDFSNMISIAILVMAKSKYHSVGTTDGDHQILNGLQ
jgi:hypothetical protein